MTELYEFMANHPILTFFLVYLTYAFLEGVIKFVVNRPLRAMNIRKHGWPPKHCDADGDFKEED
jgi:hypothetical protein